MSSALAAICGGLLLVRGLLAMTARTVRIALHGGRGEVLTQEYAEEMPRRMGLRDAVVVAARTSMSAGRQRSRDARR